jgi:oxygen-independent coproporphyrinogen-3 oxidase
MSAGVYLHIPFCRSRCSYCDFATDVYRDSGAVDRYVSALSAEISAFRDHGEVERRIDTIYFGGGTPSLLSPQQIARIMRAIDEVFLLQGAREVTMEMNPATVSPETLDAYCSLGINRASFGVQTFNDRDLKLLARGHDANDARQTFRMLREAGFENVSFDLIAGLPDQTMEDWKANLDQAIALSPEHISLYLLEIHSGTPLAEQVRSGRRKVIDEDLAAEMYEVMLDRLARAGYEQYEISNFARPGFESRHNSKYWTLDPVFGFGVSAHSFDGRERYANERDTAKYASLIEAGDSAETYRERVDLASEFLFLGLRLEQGIDIEAYSARFGVDLLATYKPELLELAESGLIDLTPERMRLTRKGKLFSNNVFSVFV